MIIFARVDSRLIHGQVVEGWLPSMKIDEVIVVSADYASSALARKMFRMSLPSGYGLQVFTPPDAADYLKQHSNLRQFVLIEDIVSLKIMLEAGIELPRINIGNTRYEHGKSEAAHGVYLNTEEAAYLRGLKESGVLLDIRALPSSVQRRFS